MDWKKQLSTSWTFVGAGLVVICAAATVDGLLNGKPVTATLNALLVGYWCNELINMDRIKFWREEAESLNGVCNRLLGLEGKE